MSDLIWLCKTTKSWCLVNRVYQRTPHSQDVSPWNFNTIAKYYGNLEPYNKITCYFTHDGYLTEIGNRFPRFAELANSKGNRLHSCTVFIRLVAFQSTFWIFLLAFSSWRILYGHGSSLFTLGDTHWDHITTCFWRHKFSVVHMQVVKSNHIRFRRGVVQVLS